MFMKVQFKNWLLKNEMAGTGAIVSCKDKKNPNFQVWGAMSDLNCKNSTKKSKKRQGLLVNIDLRDAKVA